MPSPRAEEMKHMHTPIIDSESDPMTVWLDKWTESSGDKSEHVSVFDSLITHSPDQSSIEQDNSRDGRFSPGEIPQETHGLFDFDDRSRSIEV